MASPETWESPRTLDSFFLCPPHPIGLQVLLHSNYKLSLKLSLVPLMVIPLIQSLMNDFPRNTLIKSLLCFQFSFQIPRCSQNTLHPLSWGLQDSLWSGLYPLPTFNAEYPSNPGELTDLRFMEWSGLLQASVHMLMSFSQVVILYTPLSPGPTDLENSFPWRLIFVCPAGFSPLSMFSVKI